MTDPNRQFTDYEPTQQRANQQHILPTAIKPAGLSQTTLVNTSSSVLGPVSLANGASLTIKSLIVNTQNSTFRLGSVPYAIVFFQTSLATSSIIGAGVTGSYTINGPLAIPVFTPYATASSVGGSDGNNLYYITELINNSGSTQTIYAITNTRVFTPLGGSA